MLCLVLGTSKYSSFKMSEVLNSIEDVDIDPEGVFKYILINVQEKGKDNAKKIVRGYLRCHWHGKYSKISDDYSFLFH